MGNGEVVQYLNCNELRICFAMAITLYNALMIYIRGSLRTLLPHNEASNAKVGKDI